MEHQTYHNGDTAMSLTKEQKTQYSEFMDRCKEVNPEITVAAVEVLCSLSKEYSKLGDRISNNPNIDYDRLETKKDKIKKDIEATLTIHLPGATINSYSLDPRGHAVKINLPNGRFNSFGGEGWGIPAIGFKQEVEKSR